MQKKQVWMIGSMVLLLSLAAAGYFAASGMTQGEVSSVKISEFSRWGSQEGEQIAVLKDSSEIEQILRAVQSTDEIKGVVDFVDGDFEVKVVYETDTTELFHLWINENTTLGAVMNPDDSHKLFALSESQTAELKKILWGREF
ncbi:hypothetical protein CR205_12020 [Alteribacter lacisalsi]|uniref:YhfM-like domain-containing protein n=1 Tax=Alteribacter lacisalsi TaxID=2045244 RepID=A0A2W0H645_9BACI|nr:hypothetical protein [Alteribacter lacisalsi]PYZ96441.1 hypothetical protein CR205_12020 [Alteribacter lacisalsi]